MVSSAVFSSNILSSKESPAFGLMGLQRRPAVSSTRSRNVIRFRRCFKVRAIQASGAAAAISDHGHLKSKSLYEVLEIGPAAAAKDIKRAYRNLARQCHPDHAASPEEKEEKTQIFLKIHNAYVILSDPHDRAQYDRKLSAPVRGFAGQTWRGTSNGQPPAYRYSGHMGRSWESDQCW